MEDDQTNSHPDDFTPVHRPEEQETNLPPQMYFEYAPPPPPAPMPYNQPYAGPQQQVALPSAGYTPPANFPLPPNMYAPPIPPRRNIWKVVGLLCVIIVVVGVAIGVPAYFIGEQHAVPAEVKAHSTTHSQASSNPTTHPFSNKLVLQDTLATEINSPWPIEDNCVFQNHVYRLIVKRPAWIYSCYEGEAFDNVTFEVTVSNFNAYRAGIVFRHVEDGTYYLFAVFQNGHYTCSRFENHKFDQILGQGYVPATTPLTKSFRLGVVAHDNNFGLYINGTLLSNVSDSSGAVLQNGAVGMMVGNYKNGGTSSADFTNAKVWQLPDNFTGK